MLGRKRFLDRFQGEVNHNQSSSQYSSHNFLTEQSFFKTLLSLFLKLLYMLLERFSITCRKTKAKARAKENWK